MKVTTEIDEKWNNYDKANAKCQLHNYGVIYLDEYDHPIDNEYELEDLNEKYNRDL